MSTLNIGSPPEGSADKKIAWIVQALYQMQRHIVSTSPSVVIDAFELTNPDLVVETRTLDETGATATDVRNVLATLLKDFRTRGPKGV